MLLLLLWLGLAWPIHQHTESTPKIPIPQSPKCPNAQTQFTVSVLASEVLKIDASGSLHMPQSNLLPATLSLSLSSATPNAHYFSALQLSVNNSGIFGFKMQMHRQQLSIRCKLGLLRGRLGSDIAHINIYTCIYMYAIYIHVHADMRVISFHKCIFH